MENLDQVDAELGQNTAGQNLVGQINDLSDFQDRSYDRRTLYRPCVTNGLPATFERQQPHLNLKVRQQSISRSTKDDSVPILYSEGKRPDNIRADNLLHRLPQLGN